MFRSTTIKSLLPIIKQQSNQQQHSIIASTSRLASTISSTSTPTSSSTPSTTTIEPTEQSEKTHYLLTLRRSPLHLPSPIKSSCLSLGLTHRLSSSIVPISQENAGYILRIKELITVKLIGIEEITRAVDTNWSGRKGEGKKGSGLHLMREGAGVIRVGSERCRGEERGFKIVK